MDNGMLVKGFHDLYKLAGDMTDSFVRLKDTYKAVCAALELEEEDSADGQLDR